MMKTEKQCGWGTHTDITEEKELQLKYSHQAQILEQINDSVISMDLEGTIKSWNRGSEKLLGYCSDEMIGKPFTSLFPEKFRHNYAKATDTLKKENEYRT